MKINKSRKSTHSIMGHGDIRTSMTVIRKIDGLDVKYVVPEEDIFELSRTVKKKGLKAMEEFFMNISSKKDTEVQA